MNSAIAFVGGGNMAGALLRGLLRQGARASDLVVVEPFEATREALRAELGIDVLAAADARLARAGLVVWAVKPQMFASAAAPCAAHVSGAAHLSVMAGIRSDRIAQAVGSERVVRAMPNTPALIGQGIAGLYARPAVSDADRTAAEHLLAPTGRTLWVERESDLDTVTALSGSGPAYFFYIVEAMIAAGVELGLPAVQARELALATCAGAAALAQQSSEDVSVLRQRVTSKGGTTHAALESLGADGVGEAVQRAVRAAAERARALGDEFGR